MPGLSTNGLPTIDNDEVSGDMLVAVDTQFSGGASPQSAALTLAQIQAGSFEILAAVGASQGDAADISANMVIVTVTASTEGVKLPTAVAGLRYQVAVPGSVGVSVYPNTDDLISGAATNAAVVLAAGKSNIYVAKDAQTWVVLTGA